MNKISKIAFKIAAVLILILAAAAVILYFDGYYSFSFLPSDGTGKTHDKINEDSTASDDYSDKYTEPIISADNLSSVTSTESLDTSSETSNAAPDAPKQKSFAQMTAHIPNAADLTRQGYSITDTSFKKSTHILARVSTSAKLPNVLSYGNISEEKIDYASGTVKKEGAPPTVSVSRMRPVLDTYMGWIIYDDGESTNLMTPYGKIVMTKFDVCTPAYMRDQYGRPLFYYKDALYYIESDKNYTINRSTYDSAFAPALHFDYPQDYGTPHGGFYLYYVDQKVQYIENQTQIDREISLGNEPPEAVVAEETARLYGYMNAAGEVVIKAQFYFAANFNENGLAAVGDRNRIMWLINKRGEPVINPYGTILYLAELNRRPVIDSYGLPDTYGDENLGMFCFDNGLMRIHHVLLDYYDHANVIGAEDILITANGKEYDIPGGYNLKHYSDGVLILEKDGKYGAFSKDGHWIAQPIYTYASYFKEGLCAIGFENGKKALIDTDGNIVLPFAFDYISIPSGGVVTAYEKSNGWFIYNKMAIIKK